MKFIKHLSLFILPVLIWAETAPTPPASARNREALATYIGNNKISIDGELNEPIWETANWQKGLYQRNPNDGEKETFSTEFCIMFDDECLYIAGRAFDPEPDKIIAVLTRRDRYSESDWMYVSIDSYNDNRTSFEFGLNAAGVKHDQRRFDDENGDDGWDAIWNGSTQINDDSWTAEWCIPFSELRFSSSDNMEWGFQFYRELPRKNSEFSVWNYWAKSDEGFVSNFGKLTGLKNIQSSQPVYVSPYVASQTNISDDLITPVHENNYDFLYNIGGDIRYSSPNGFTVNATLNPDFGQVEADPADFNLTEFETYFSEKRSFFLEGSNIMRFPLGFGDGNNGANTLFYSRRIGRSPQGYINTDDDKDIVSTTRPDFTNIIGAAKVTGKTDEGLSVGVMEALTAREEGIVYYDDNTKSTSVIEPMTNYFLSRVQQDFNDGQASVGAILTAVNRDLHGTGIDYLHSSAYTGGIDANYEFLDREYEFLASVAFSQVNGDTTAIQYTQMSSARYFQRPDADHLEYDPTLTSLGGYSVKSVLQKNKGHIRAATGVTAYSPGFEANDMGYIQSVDNIQQFAWMQYYNWKGNKLFREYRLNFNQWWSSDFNGMRKYAGGNINFHFVFHNNYYFGFGINRNIGGMSPSQNRGGPALKVVKNGNVWGYLNTDERKKLSANIFGYYFKNADEVLSTGINPSITYRPVQNLQLSAEVDFEILNDTWAWVGKTEDNTGEMQYFWSDMDQKNLSFVLRADLTLTPTLSLQYYAQPFFIAGEYFNFKVVNDPEAEDIQNRFTELDERFWYDDVSEEYNIDMDLDGSVDYSFGGNTDFNYKQFRSNLVVRWEYSIGSSAYFVWSQGFTHYQSFRQFHLSKDVNTLFNSTGNNVFMIKISQSLNF